MKSLKEKIQSGETVHGCWLNLGSLVSAEIVGRAGFDWVLIDLEHGAVDITSMYHQLQILENTEATAIVRTDELSRSRVQHILDAGAAGIMFPQLRQQREAELATSMMYYPPRGIRGMAKMVRATGFGRRGESYMQNLERYLVGVIQIETIEAVRDIDAIAATPGVDVLFVGPSDLSMAYGVFGQLNHPLYQQAIREVADAAEKNGKTPGVLLQHVHEYEMYRSLGYRFLACGADGSFVTHGAADMVNELNARRMR